MAEMGWPYAFAVIGCAFALAWVIVTFIRKI